MAIFCDKNCPSCCNHCKHFVSDPDDDTVEPVGDGFLGDCTLYEKRTDPLDECVNFFCVAAARNGTGYIGQSTDYCKGPFVLDVAFFDEQIKQGWCFTKEDVVRKSSSKSDH